METLRVILTAQRRTLLSHVLIPETPDHSFAQQRLTKFGDEMGESSGFPMLASLCLRLPKSPRVYCCYFFSQVKGENSDLEKTTTV